MNNIYKDMLDKMFINPTEELSCIIQEEVSDFMCRLRDYLPELWDIHIEEAPIDKFAGIVSIYKKDNSQIKYPLFYLAIENNMYTLTSQYLTDSLFFIPFISVSGQRKIKNRKDMQKALINIIKNKEFIRLLRGLEICN